MSTARIHAVTSDPVHVTPPLTSFALARIWSQVGGAHADPDSVECRFLGDHAASTGSRDGRWRAELERAWANPNLQDLPLLSVATHLGMSPFEVLCCALALSVEENVMTGRAVAYAQDPVGGSRPTVGLALALFADALGEPDALELLVSGPMAAAGLVLLEPAIAPLPERSLRIPDHLFGALRGRHVRTDGVALAPAEDTIPLPSAVLEEAARRATILQHAGRGVLVLRSRSLAERRSVARHVAEGLSLEPAFIRGTPPVGATAWLHLRGLLPVFELEPAPGETRRVPEIPLYEGPLLATCGIEGAVDGPGGVVADWTLPMPSYDERIALWREAVDEESLADWLAANHRHGAGRIAQLGRVARHEAHANGTARPTRDDFAKAAWTLEGGGLSTLAQAIPDQVDEDAFVVPDALAPELNGLLARCRFRDQLVDGLGASTGVRYRPGVRALFVGPSGTGKTMAAAWLGTKLGLPLYRVDLAAVTSKYIGETEKNLAELLSKAEEAEVVLLFDEADSLFGKRTEVRDANDRFANAQTNYLLQRIETYEGIAVLTSNSRGRFDASFMRRLDLILEFPLPNPDERRRLWLSHLGREHRLTQGELNRLAGRVNLPGGHIRNVVLAAATAARSEGTGLRYSHVIRGLEAEYRKLGQPMAADLSGTGQEPP